MDLQFPVLCVMSDSIVISFTSCASVSGTPLNSWLSTTHAPHRAHQKVQGVRSSDSMRGEGEMKKGGETGGESREAEAEAAAADVVESPL